MRIVDANNRRALERVFARDRSADRAFLRRVATIVDRVRQDGDRALLRFARRFDDARPPIEVSHREMIAEAERVPVSVRRAIQQAARNIAKVAARQVPKSVLGDGRARRVRRTARRAAGTSRLLRAGRTISAPLLAADDGDPCAHRRSLGGHRGVSAARTGRDGCGARSRRHATLSRRRCACDRRAGVRHRYHSTRRQDRRPRQSVCGGSQSARLCRLRHRLLRRPNRNRRRRQLGAA